MMSILSGMEQVCFVSLPPSYATTASESNLALCAHLKTTTSQTSFQRIFAHKVPPEKYV